MKANNKSYVFVDLAGSERGVKSKYGNRKDYYEMAGINTDIFYLKECIRHMKDNQKRIPFRATKLTMALRESFYDQYSSMMIVTVSPEKSNTIETLNILSCAADIKLTKRKPRVELVDGPLVKCPLAKCPLAKDPLVKCSQVKGLLPVEHGRQTNHPKHPRSVTPISSRFGQHKPDQHKPDQHKQNKYKQVGEPDELPQIQLYVRQQSEKSSADPTCLPKIVQPVSDKKKPSDVKKYGKLLKLVLKSMDICSEFIELPDDKKPMATENFGTDMALVLTDQVGVIRNIDEKFGRKFFALS